VDDGGAQSQGFAVLCTENKTFQILQQQTSNPIMVIQPSADHGGICAVSTCRSTLGLSQNTGESDAEAHLRDLLRLWNGTIQTGGQEMSKMDVYENMPLSKAEIDAEWKRSCAFEKSGCCYLPTAHVLLSSWKAIADASRAEAIDLLDQSQQDTLWDAVSDEGIPKELFLVMLSRLTATDAEVWVATFMLEANGGALPRTQFVESWRDLLPERLASNASIDMLKVISQHFWHGCY
jgi:sister chromatid cohesion protein DCC1